MDREQKPEYDYMFKIILIGSSAVGKSNILLRFTRDQFNESHVTTTGVEFAAKNVNANGKVVRLQVWDTMGQERYKAINRTFYKGASAILLTYDLTSERSFQDLDNWYKQIKQYGKDEVIIMLVGNKSDMEDKRQVSKQRGLEYAEKNKIAFYEVSAKDGTNVELIFTKLAEELEKIMKEADDQKKNQQQEKKKAENKVDSTATRTPSEPIKLTTQSSKQAPGSQSDKKCCK